MARSLPLPPITRGTVVTVMLLLAVAAGCFRYADQAAPGKKAVERLQAAWNQEKPPPWRHVTRVWLPRAAWVNGWLALAAAAAVPWARRPLRGAGGGGGAGGRPTGSPATDSPRVRRLGWCGVAVLAGVAAWSTAPRLHQSVWGDEARTLREFLVGQFHTGPDGERRFDAATWGDAFFHFRTPNNHVLYSVAARGAHLALARPSERAEAPYFSEWAIRLPAWLAGMAAVFSVAGLGAVLGWRRAGWLAAGLLVLHPGFVRYAAEARGYAFLLAGGPLLLTALVLAVRTGMWRWWGLAAALDFALLYTWPLSLHLVAVANLCALGALVAGGARPRTDRLTLALRWGLTALGAAAVWLQLFLPCLLQLRFWMRTSGAQQAPGSSGGLDALGTLLTGRVWRDADPGNPLLTPWARTWETQPWLVVLSGALVLGGLAAGLVALWRQTPAWRGWLPALVLPPLLILAQALTAGSVLYPWYLMIGVPGALLVLAIGLEATATRLTCSARGQAVLLGLGAALFGLSGQQARDHLRQHPIEPNREAALMVQPVLNPFHPDYQRTVLTAGFHMRNTIYDPGVREFRTVTELQALMDEAARTGRDLSITYGQQKLARLAFPEVMALLDDPAVFRQIATLPGQEDYCTRYIVRHSPAPR